MSCPCTSTLDLGCFDTCSQIVFATATQTGNHILRYEAIPGQVLQETISFALGNSIQVTDDGADWQPGYTYIVWIVNPDGTDFTETVSGTVYDCWQFTLNKTITIT